MQKLTMLFFLFIFSGKVQAQDFPKDIYEMYDLTPGGCEYLKVEGGKSLKNAATIKPPYPIPPPPPPPLPERQNLEEFSIEDIKESLMDFKNAVKNIDKNSIVPSQKLRNGNVCFFKNGKWGLRDANGKTILKPQFEYIKVDTFSGGFAGYGAVKGNYYDGKTGKKLLTQDYYHIEVVDKNVFIVQSKDGFGLIKDGKAILANTMYRIEKSSYRNNFGKSFYYLKVKDGKNHQEAFLLSDWETFLPCHYSSYYQRPQFIGRDYMVNSSNVFDLKKMKRLICEEDGSLKFLMIDEKRKILAVKKKRERYWHLIDIKGNFISEQPFSRIEKMNEEGFAVAVFRKEYPNKVFEQEGLVDSKGNWMPSTKYKSIAGNYAVVKNDKGRSGIIDSLGNIIVPFIYSNIKKIAGHQFLCYKKRYRDYWSKIIDARSGKVIKDNLNWRSVSKSRKTECGGKVWIARTYERKYIIDENFELITPKKGNYIIRKDEIIVGYKQLCDCNGKPKGISINGVEYFDFYSIGEYNEDLIYVTLPDKTSYLVDKNGVVTACDAAIRKFKHRDVGMIDWKLRKGNNETGAFLRNKAIQKFLTSKFRRIKNEYLTAGLFSFTTNDNKIGFFNLKGDLINDKLYETYNTYPSSFGLYFVGEGPRDALKYGVIGKDGKMILPVKYHYVYMKKGIIHAIEKKGGQEVYFDRKGKRIR